MSNWLTKSGLIMLFLMFSSVALALRCGNALITTGDYRTTVLKKCGEPDDRISYTREVGAAQRVVKGKEEYYTHTIYVEEWIYDRGPQDFVYSVKIENGRVISVESEKEFF